MTHVTSIATFLEVVVKINRNFPLNTRRDTGAKISQTSIQLYLKGDLKPPCLTPALGKRSDCSELYLCQPPQAGYSLKGVSVLLNNA